VRIGLLTTSYPRSPGDPAGCFVAEHAAYLARAGHEVEVLAAGPGPEGPAVAFGVGPAPAAGVGGVDGPDGAPGVVSVARAAGLDPALVPGRVSVVRVPARPGLFDGGGAPEELGRSARAWLAGARFTAALARAAAVRARGWDAVAAHWLVPSALAALAAAPGLPLLAIAHSGDVHLLRRLRALGVLGALCDRPDVRLSFVSHELRRLFLERAPRCERLSQVCPMGIDVARLRAARATRDGQAARDARAARVARANANDVGGGDGPATVLFLGRLVPVKGIDHLVRAALAWRSGARLVIAGAGPDEAALRSLAAAAPPGRISFAGEVRGAERDRALAAADVVALPSVRMAGGRSEGLPVVALEAMAAGAALVASAVGGLADLPPGAVTRVPPGDPASLAAAIDALLLDRDRLAAQVAAQDRFIPDLDWSAVGPRLLPPPRSRALDRGTSFPTPRWARLLIRLA